MHFQSCKRVRFYDFETGSAMESDLSVPNIVVNDEVAPIRFHALPRLREKCINVSPFCVKLEAVST